MGPTTPDEARSKMALVRAAAERAGRDPAELDYAYNVGVRLGGPPPPDPERSVAGEPDEVIERLLEFLEAGFTVLNFWIGGRREEQADRLATEVVPHLRQFAG